MRGMSGDAHTCRLLGQENHVTFPSLGVFCLVQAVYDTDIQAAGEHLGDIPLRNRLKVTVVAHVEESPVVLAAAIEPLADDVGFTGDERHHPVFKYNIKGVKCVQDLVPVLDGPCALDTEHGVLPSAEKFSGLIGLLFGRIVVCAPQDRVVERTVSKVLRTTLAHLMVVVDVVCHYYRPTRKRIGHRILHPMTNSNNTTTGR